MSNSFFYEFDFKMFWIIIYASLFFYNQACNETFVHNFMFFNSFKQLLFKWRNLTATIISESNVIWIFFKISIHFPEKKYHDFHWPNQIFECHVIRLVVCNLKVVVLKYVVQLLMLWCYKFNTLSTKILSYSQVLN